MCTQRCCKMYQQIDGRPYQRVGSTTSIMPQENYQRLLTERSRSQHHWENQLADGYDIPDLNQEEILRTVRLGIAAGRLPESTGNDISDILTRFEMSGNDRALPFGLKPQDLKCEHSSRPRNPLIANVFYLRSVIERWGSGTQKIVELCVKAGHQEPEFDEQAGSVWIRFLPSGYIAHHRVTHDLTDRQRGLLQVLATSPSMAFRDVKKSIKNPPPDRSLREDLLHLKRLGLVKPEGFGQGAVWRLQHSHIQ